MSESSSYYENHYQQITNTGSIGFVAKIGHMSLERWPFTRIGSVDSKKYLKILEVGSGHGQHYKYVKNTFEKYLMTDVRPELLKDIRTDTKGIEIEKLSINAEKLPYEDNSFDRLIATCLLIHLDNPEQALGEWKRVVRQGGVISIYVPCEPGLILRTLQAFTTRHKQYKLGLNAKHLHYSEHRYSYPYIIAVLNNVYPKINIRVRKFPFIFGSFDINLWSSITVTNVK